MPPAEPGADGPHKPEVRGALAWTEHVGGVVFATTDRLGGVSAPPYDFLNLGGRVGDDPAAVAENRQRVAAAVGVVTDRLVLMAQVHGRDVAVLTDPPRSAPRVDAVVTARRELALVAMGADCAPVMLADPGAGIIGVAHAGRVGLVVGVLVAVVQKLRDLGARELVGRVGPAICGRCYEVPALTRDEVAAAVPAAATTTQWGTPGVDIGAGALATLHDLGVDATQVGGCTYESPALYSHRRDGVTGRHAGVVVLR